MGSWQLLVFLGVFGHAILEANAASTHGVAARYPRRLENNKAYLPPFTAPQFGEKEENSLNSYDTPTTQDADTFQTTPQVGSIKSRVGGGGSPKFFTSYAPAPSGLGANTFQYSAPQPSQRIPLPSLIPASVRDQLSATTGHKVFSTAPQTLTTLPLPAAAATQPLATSTEAVPPSTETLMLDQTTPAQLLTSQQNRTIEAARLLASTLLEASGEQPLEHGLNGVQVVDTNSLAANPGQQLNSTDVVIVKSQKHAYIIPMQLARDGATPLGLRELYSMRDQLPKAYTVNQFIFIIKPEKINFLNKLV